MPARRHCTALLAAIGFALCCPCAVLAQADAKAVIVTLRASAVVDEPVVMLGAVASIDGGEPWIRQKIGSLDVAEVSAAGKSVVISCEQVALRIQLAGFDTQSFKVIGPAQTMVKMVAVGLTQEDVVKVAQQAVMQRLKAAPQDVEFRLVEPVRLPALSIAPDESLRFVVETQSQAITVGKTRIDVGIVVNGQRRAAVTVVLEVSACRDAVIATRRIEAGELLQADCLRKERRAVRPGDAWVPYSDQLLGKRVAHAISAGQTITSASLALPVDDDEVVIHNRDTIKLVAVLGSMRVLATGEALQDGKLGQLIRVRNIESGKTVAGRVLDSGNVEVEY
ncbi:MAG TPA: flagellar basal body P-ring formation chaperone FlgA [Gemmataceae bacterium]|nr:flagellar basal body P-ring formation chaperone FlgA [Gemmataceae bacterium]